MDYNRTKHLEFLQNIIARMNTHSFQIKTFAITIISAMIVFLYKNENMSEYSLIFTLTLDVIIVSFWVLDTFYLQIEKKYRRKYEKLILDKDCNIYDLSVMGGDMFKEGKFVYVMFSKTLFIYYMLLMGITWIPCIITIIS